MHLTVDSHVELKSVFLLKLWYYDIEKQIKVSVDAHMGEILWILAVALFENIGKCMLSTHLHSYQNINLYLKLNKYWLDSFE